MLGIYAKTFMTATGHSEVRPHVRKLREPEIKPRRWSAAGHWIDPPQDF